MTSSRLVSACFLTALISACGTPGDYLEVPEKPDDIRESVTITTKPSRAFEPDVVKAPHHSIKPESSVVISVSDFESYETSGFKDAEQQIERGLIEHGFRVLSREKFEAKLRDLRDQATAKGGTEKREAFRPRQQKLEEQFRNGEISEQEFDRKMKALEEDNALESAGRAENDRRELKDISEVIRAAQSGDVQSDYILLINSFNNTEPVPYEVDLEEYEKYQKLMERYPEVRFKLQETARKTCTGYQASLNAKLINVETGDIVWIGNHTVMSASLGETPIKFRTEVTKFVDNYAEIENFVYDQNSEEVRNERGTSTMDKLMFKGNTDEVVRIPDFTYEAQTEGPKVIDGLCGRVSSKSREGREKLWMIQKLISKSVAKELIGSIKVSRY